MDVGGGGAEGPIKRRSALTSAFEDLAVKADQVRFLTTRAALSPRISSVLPYSRAWSNPPRFRWKGTATTFISQTFLSFYNTFCATYVLQL